MLRLVLALLILPLLPACASAEGPQAELPLSPLVIETASGEHRFTVELADEPEEQRIGLMGRPELAADRGMLFVYPADGPIGFWMKNTPASLDMIFLDAQGRVLNVAVRTEPLSLEVHYSEGEGRAVLEVRAGTAERIGLAPGDRVRHEAFGAAP